MKELGGRELDLGKRLLFYRKKNKLTQEVLAKGICSISYYSKIETGQITPSREIISLLCQRLGVNKSEIHLDRDSLLNIKEKFKAFSEHLRIKNRYEIKSHYQDIVGEFSENQNPSIMFIVILAHLRMSLLENDYNQAKEYYKRMIEIIDYMDEDMTLYYKWTCGLYHYLLGNMEESLNYYKLVEKEKDYPFKEEVYYQISLIYSWQNNPYLSSDYAKKALEIFASKMNYEQCTNCHLILGVNFFKLKEYEKATKIYHKILKQASTNTNLKGKVYHYLGLLHSEVGQSELAIRYYYESYRFKDEVNTITSTLYLMAKEYYHLNKNIDAEKWAKKGLHLAKKFFEKEYEIKLQLLLLLIANESFEVYIKSVAIPYFEQKGDFGSVRELIQILANYYEENRSFEQAYFLLKNHLKIEGNTSEILK